MWTENGIGRRNLVTELPLCCVTELISVACRGAFIEVGTWI